MKYKAKSEIIGIHDTIDIPEGSIGVKFSHVEDHWNDNFNDSGVEEYLVVQWLQPVES